MRPRNARCAPIRAAAFDIGDVLFTRTSPTDFFTCWEQHLGRRQHLGAESGWLQGSLWHGPDIEAANIGTITAEEYYQRCAARCGLDEDTVRVILEEFFSGEYLNQELVSYIETLKPHIQVVALTNTWSFGRSLIERRGISSLFDSIISSAEEGVRKPHPRIYEIMLERLGAAASEVLFVDDNPDNVDAARAQGMHAVQFCSSEQTIDAVNRILSAYHDEPY